MGGTHLAVFCIHLHKIVIVLQMRKNSLSQAALNEIGCFITDTYTHMLQFLLLPFISVVSVPFVLSGIEYL